MSRGGMGARTRVLGPIVAERLYRRPHLSRPLRHGVEIARRIGAAQSRQELERRRQLRNPFGRAVGIGDHEARPIEVLFELVENWLEAAGGLDWLHRRTDIADLVVLKGSHRARHVGDVHVAHVEVGVGDVEAVWRRVIDNRLGLTGAQGGFEQLARPILRQRAIGVGEELQLASAAARKRRIGRLRCQRRLILPRYRIVVFRERPWRRRCRAGKNLDVFTLPPFGILVVLRRVYGRNQLREQRDRYRDALPRRDAALRIDIEPEGRIPSIS